MARGNHVSVKGDITGNIYYDIQTYKGKQVYYLRLYMMVKGGPEACEVRGLRVCMYGLLAEITRAHVEKGSRIFVEGHIQIRSRQTGGPIVEVVAEEVDFIRNIDYDRGSRAIDDMRKRGLFNTVNPNNANQLATVAVGHGGDIVVSYDSQSGLDWEGEEDEEEHASPARP